MIIGNTTQDGKLITSLKPQSKKKVLKECDFCKKQKWVCFADIKRCKSRQNFNYDLCLKCGSSFANSGEKNQSKKSENRKKISEATKGKSKSFKDGKHYRFLPKKINTAGYSLIFDESIKEHVIEHRKVMEDFIGRKLLKDEVIHHIDGDKLNNDTKNLCLFSCDKDHQLCHSSGQKLIYEFIKKNIIKFDYINNKYYIDPYFLIKTMDKSIGFNDAAILQGKNICNSRSGINIKSEIIRGVIRPIPLIASNMSSVSNSEFINKLFKLGAFGIMHRAINESILIEEIKLISKECEWTAASIGIGDDQFNLAENLIKSGANIIVIDIAHGYCNSVIELAKKIKIKFSDIKIIVGNTTNIDMLKETYKFIDGIKIGIGQGLACETANTAGCTEKQMSVVLKFKVLANEMGIPVISDGGIRGPSDFVKCIGGGASSAMAGSIFARCPESAAEIVEIDGVKKKIYSGMASRLIQEQWRGKVHNDCPEGKTLFLDLGESVEKLLERYSGALRSGISYAGFDNIEDFKKGCEFILI